MESDDVLFMCIQHQRELIMASHTQCRYSILEYLRYSLFLDFLASSHASHA